MGWTVRRRVVETYLSKSTGPHAWLSLTVYNKGGSITMAAPAIVPVRQLPFGVDNTSENIHLSLCKVADFCIRPLLDLSHGRSRET